MINRPPSNWKDLQIQVNEIFQRSGLNSETDKQIKTIRGTVNIDVYAEDSSNQPTTIYLCECKYWKSKVSKTIVHALRTVVQDYGANWGFVISSKGFQSGAYIAAKNSPIQLLTWDKFQKLFIDRWIRNYMIPRLKKELDPLMEYTEPINTRIFRKANMFDDEKELLFRQLRERYWPFAMFILLYLASESMKECIDFLNLPLRKNIQKKKLIKANLPDELLDASYLRDFVDIVCRYGQEGITAFDQLFGERA
jgi:restriction system protein